PQQPVIVRHEAVEFAVPLLRQALVELLDKRQNRPLRRKSFLVPVNRNVRVPPEPLPIWRETEPIEKILAADQRNVPEARNAARVLLDRNLRLEPPQQFRADGVGL